MSRIRSETFFKALTLRFKLEHDEDHWEYTEEPHISRRQEILQKYPQIKKLMGYDPRICLIVSAIVFAQIAICAFIRFYQPNYIVLFIAAYCVGACLNHSLGTAVHEIGHNLAFGHKRPMANRLLSIWCNLPMGIPLAISYRKYHSDHHRWLGHDQMDVDIPTRIESYLFRNPLTKVIWLILHPVIHSVRPFFKSPKPVTNWEAVNFLCQIIFDLLIAIVFGPKALVYLILGTLLGLGLHPLAGHFISEHYLFTNSQATHSYYGPLNIVLFNVGYHIEHHDFPYIPYTQLPKLREIAPEYYKDLPHHTSLIRVLWQFIWQKHLGPQGRAITSQNVEKSSIFDKQQVKIKAT